LATRLAASPAAQIGIGLAIAALAQLLSLFLAAAGHGWVAPLPASLLLWVMTPLALLFARSTLGSGRKALLPMVLIAVIADGWLIMRTIDEGNALADYLALNGIAGYLIVAIWICLWLLWQAIVVRGLSVARRSTND